jgi:hypothetical protein
LKASKETIAKGNSGVRMVDRREKGRASYVAKRGVRREMRTEGARILHGGVSLVIEKLNGKLGINRGLVWIIRRPSDLIEAEPA